MDNINNVINEYQNLVRFIANKYTNNGIDTDDLIQSGNIGLIQAYNTYQKSKGKFMTYAYKCIRNEILKEIQNNGVLIRTPAYKHNFNELPLLVDMDDNKHSTNDNNDLYNLLSTIKTIINDDKIYKMYIDHYYYDLSYRDIANGNDISHVSVKNLLDKTHELIRKELNNE